MMVVSFGDFFRILVYVLDKFESGVLMNSKFKNQEFWWKKLPKS